MTSLPPSLPSLAHLSAYVTIDGIMGYMCGKLSQVNPNLTGAIFAIRALANTLFYHIANYTLGARNLKSQKIFLGTSTLVNMTFLIALRELNAIGRLPSCFLGVVALGYLISRVSYIQDQERQLIQEESQERQLTQGELESSNE